jgi:hypothetical protein
MKAAKVFVKVVNDDHVSFPMPERCPFLSRPGGFIRAGVKYL